MTQTRSTRTRDDDRPDARGRLAALIHELAPDAEPPRAARPSTEPTERAEPVARTESAEPADWAAGRAGRLVERWIPGGTKGVTGFRSVVGRHRFAVVVAIIALLAVIVAAVVLAGQRPVVEPAPPLPAAVNVGPVTATPTIRPPTTIVISVVGRITTPGLVTLPDGARVADAIRAAGGVLPGTDDTALNLARRLTDGEQIYVGIPVPPAATPDPPTDDAAPDTPDSSPDTKKGRKSTQDTDPSAKVDLNTATADELQTLPGIGPTMAQRILTWRNQHGHFDSISQLRDVGGIGDAKFAKINKLVTT